MNKHWQCPLCPAFHQTSGGLVIHCMTVHGKTFRADEWNCPCGHYGSLREMTHHFETVGRTNLAAHFSAGALQRSAKELRHGKVP